MVKPGPKPKPIRLKKLAGNPGKRKLNSGEPQFDVPGRMPSPPEYLSETAAEIWKDLGRQLLDAGLFTVVDKYALAMFCVAAGRWIESEIELKTSSAVLESKDGNLYQNPLLHVANRAWDQMRQMFGEFGLTPAERSRLKVSTGEKELSLAEQLNEMVRDAVENGRD